MGASAAKLRKRYFSFFVDHNMIDRVTFFRDPLIQCLWGKFRQGYAAKILDYMKSLNPQSPDEAKPNHERFVKDVKHIEYISMFGPLLPSE